MNIGRVNMASAVDALLEVPVVPSFTRIGFDVRSRLGHWTALSSYDLHDRHIALTGASSGLGLATAQQLAALGATLTLVGRDRAKTERVAEQLIETTGNQQITVEVADLADLDAVRAASAQILERAPRLDALIHNAGALLNERRSTAEGIESTIASQVLGPFLMTSLLLGPLRAAGPGRVITVASGGMYATGLDVEHLQMDGDHYNGTEQYARAKRAQVTLNELWADRVDRREVVFHAMHPGWADTPGVRASLPTFRKVMGPLLRSPQQGADTIVWLTADGGEPLASSGDFWLDRHRRSLHKLPSTRRSDTPEQRRRLWEWVVANSTASPEPAG